MASCAELSPLALALVRSASCPYGLYPLYRRGSPGPHRPVSKHYMSWLRLSSADDSGECTFSVTRGPTGSRQGAIPRASCSSEWCMGDPTLPTSGRVSCGCLLRKRHRLLSTNFVKESKLRCVHLTLAGQKSCIISAALIKVRAENADEYNRL